MPSAWPMAAKKHKPIPKAEGRGGIPGPDCQKSPSRTTCAYGWDTYREICRRECARPQGRVRGSAANFVPRGKHSDRVLRTKQGAVFGAVLQFLQGHSCPQEKLAKHKRTAVQIFKRAAARAENLGNGNPDLGRGSRNPLPPPLGLAQRTKPKSKRVPKVNQHPAAFVRRTWCICLSRRLLCQTVDVAHQRRFCIIKKGEAPNG